MICKKCNEKIEGGQCPNCGEKPKLVNRSNEMDILMLQTQRGLQPQTETRVQIQKDSNIQSQIDSRKTYQQGLEMGYQNGLKDGYNKATNENRNTKCFPDLKKKYLWAYLLVLLVIVSVSCVISGVANYRKGLRQGEEKGYSLAVSEGEKEKEERYNEGYLISKDEGFKEGYQSRLSESQQSKITATEEIDSSVLPIQLYSKTKQKSKGVITIQKTLNTLLDLSLKEDGQFGDGTERAIKQFQATIGLDTTGIVDPETLGWLFFFWDHVEEFKSKYGLSGNEGQIETKSTEPTPSVEAVPSETPVSLNVTEQLEMTIIPSATLSPEDETQEEPNATPGTAIVPNNPIATDETNTMDNDGSFF